MNQHIWNGLTTTLLITALGAAASTYADQSGAVDQVSEANLASQEKPLAEAATNQPVQASNAFSQSEPKTEPQVVKVGERQSQTTSEEESLVAKVQSHTVSGRQAATVYVRNIPVLTFLGVSSTQANETKLGEVKRPTSLVGTRTNINFLPTVPPTEVKKSSTPEFDVNRYQEDPVWRATTIAAQINQMNRERVDANSITAYWDATRSRYQIRVAGKQLVEFNSEIQLADTTYNLEQDTLQATNRLRRLLGQAPPLQEIQGRGEPEAQQLSLGPVRIRISGYASWYGPGFDGGMSASGEVFNQNALTAAHRDLPFGTKVRVTNTDNGRSVVVRINDRGPFVDERVIDLSRAAAEVIGLVNAGVAPVRLDVLGN